MPIIIVSMYWYRYNNGYVVNVLWIIYVNNYMKRFIRDFSQVIQWSLLGFAL